MQPDWDQKLHFLEEVHIHKEGHVVEIYGLEASVLITFAFHLIAEAQKQGGLCLFVHEEHFLDHQALAEAIGVKTENLLVLSPACGVDALDVVDTLIRNCSLSVIVVDNVAALVPISERYGE